MNSHSLSIHKDLFDPSRDEEDVRELAIMVVLTQLTGLLLIFFGLWPLKNMPNDLWSIVILLLVVGGAVTIIWFVYCWYDSIINAIYAVVRAVGHFFSKQDDDPSIPPVFVPRIPPLSPPGRKTRVYRGILALVVADNCLLALLVLISGGPGRSSLDPLLPMIVIIAIILRQPARTVGWALAFELIIISALGVHWIIHTLHIGHPDLSPEWIYDSHSDPRFSLAFATVAAGSVVLSVIEYLIIHARPQLAKRIGPSVSQVGELLPNLKDLTKAIKKGTKSWIKWLTHRGIPPIDLSLVHDHGNVVKQAVILSIPCWSSEISYRKKKRITRHITFLTFAAHWIDDHFDALSTHCRNGQLQQKLLLSHPENIIYNIHPRLAELLKRMEKLADKNHQAQIKRAVVRIIYGGLIQNAPTEERLAELLKEYKEYISQGLCTGLKNKYDEIFSQQPLSVWVTSKVVMELLDSCSPTFSIDVAEFYNLLYGPILYYQNREQEISMENFGAAFGATPTEIARHLPEVSDMVLLVNTCINLAPEVLGTTGLQPARKTQLRILRDLYRDTLPSDLFNSYDYFLTAEVHLGAVH